MIDTDSAAALAAMTPSEPTGRLVPVDTSPPETVADGVAPTDDAPGIDALFALLDDPDDQRLRALGALLFPPELVGNISANAPEPCGAIRALVIPDVRIWSVPWAALPYGDQSTSQSRLAETVMVSVAPSVHAMALSSTARQRQSVPAARAIAWLSGVSGEQLERAALDESFHGQVDHPESARDFLRRLSDRSHEFAIASVHGRARVGLGHALDLGQDVQLSAAHLLGIQPPRVWVVGACWAGRIDPDPASDPLGLPTLAMITGSDHILAGVYPLPDGDLDASSPTAALLADVYPSLARDVAPDVALWLAQQGMRAAGTPAHHWAGLVDITSGYAGG